ncbi:MAG: PSD1 and planctomycete cytochrome C domain-containing protein [Planctomycetaceae bacterium]
MRLLSPPHIFSIVALLLAGVSPLAAQQKAVDFKRDVRPILSDKCFACHGPDEKSREGGLRLDQRAGAFGTADSEEPVIIPGDVDKSLLIQRISSDDENERMPPPDHGKPLTAAEIELLKRWVANGAKWEDHWSFVVPTKPEVPQVAGMDPGKSEIDAFIRQRLADEGLKFSPRADKRTLIRRVTLDLTGLPPTPEEVDAFLADESPNAFEKVVDRLLSSERYGEHMGRFWLDAARYGDTHGLHLDNYREMWPYRDWVVSAFNRNLPYDEFVIEQIAGDLLENATDDQRIASGFNRCHVTTSEGGSIAEEVYTRNVVDRVVTTGTVMLGLTFDCTRCHDHKFDPFTMKEFYGLFAYFNSLDRNPLDGNAKDPAPIMKVPSPEQAQQLAAFDAELKDMKQRMQGEWPKVDAAQRIWMEELHAALVSQEPAAGKAQWEVLPPVSSVSQGGATLTLQEDQSVLASGENPAKEVYEFVLELGEGTWETVRLEGLTHPSLTEGGHGRSSNSNVVLTGFEAYSANSEGTEEWQRVGIDQAWADHEQSNGDFKIANAIDDKPDTGWATAGYEKKENRTALFHLKSPVQGPTKLKVVVRHESKYAQHQFGRVRLSVSHQNQLPINLPEEIRNLLKGDLAAMNAEQLGKLRTHYREKVTSDTEFIQLRDALAKKQKERDTLNGQIPTTLISSELPEPKPSFLLTRGEYDQKGDQVERRVPAVLSPFKEEWPNDRLGFAYWLTDSSNPLTSRVAVNRFWQQVFGTGLVKTSEDFGSQGEPPSHPELLDWLAVTFQEDGWDVKRFMKRLVMSDTYQQSSAVTPEVLEKDPKNRLLAHGPRFRLDAEVLRDQALFVSDMLVEKLGGPSVKPPQPDGLWLAVGYSGSNTVRFTPDKGPEKVHRRTLYTFYKRTAPPPQMTTFDGPSREACTVRRERTNTPLQSLLMFNDPQFVEAARGLAQRALEHVDGNEDRLSYMFLLVTGRNPTDQERAELSAGFSADLAHYQAHAEAAGELLKIGEFPLPTEYDAAELAALTMSANLMLNLDEVVSKN